MRWFSKNIEDGVRTLAVGIRKNQEKVTNEMAINVGSY